MKQTLLLSLSLVTCSTSAMDYEPIYSRAIREMNMRGTPEERSSRAMALEHESSMRIVLGYYEPSRQNDYRAREEKLRDYYLAKHPEDYSKGHALYKLFCSGKNW